jgi:hypothetical protein
MSPQHGFEHRPDQRQTGAIEVSSEKHNDRRVMIETKVAKCERNTNAVVVRYTRL